MRVLLVFLFIITLGPKIWANEVQFGTFYETNTFYSDNNQKSGIAFFVKPIFDVQKKLSSFYDVTTDAKFEYDHFMKYSKQSFFNYDVHLVNNFDLSQRFHIHLIPFATLKSEPAQTENAKRLERRFMGASTGFVYNQNERKTFSFDVSFKREQMSQSAYSFLDNDRLEAFIYQKKYFLPETFYYYGFRLGSNNYPKGDSSPQNRDKYNSRRIEPGIGLEGRLTRYFKVRSYFGYAFIQYEKDISFKDPVFLVELEEELSPRDLILLGFQNTTEDSYYTNFLSTEKVYVGYGRFLGDQLLSTTKIEYAYVSFSRPQRRDDQRLAIATELEYSYSQKLKLQANFLFDLLSSDGVDPTGAPDPTPIDPSTSYKNMRLTLSGKYLF